MPRAKQERESVCVKVFVSVPSQVVSGVPNRVMVEVGQSRRQRNGGNRKNEEPSIQRSRVQWHKGGDEAMS
jgi:hypothetical protein